ncbi:MAG: EamA family transporter [Pseudomonadota bacterium]
MSSARFSKSLVAWVTMLTVGFLWGLTIPLSKIAVSTGHQPFGLIFWQLVIGVLVLGVVQIVRGWRPKLSGGLIGFFTVIAFSGTLIPNSTSYLAQQHLPAGVMAIVIATVPMFSLAFAVSLRIEPASWVRLGGIIAGFAAMVMIALPETSLPDPDKAVFLLVALVAPVFYGIESVYVAIKQPDEVDAITILFMASLVGGLIALPLSLVSGQWINPLDPWGNAEWALIASSVIHVLVYTAFMWLIRFAGPVFSDQAAYPVTVTGVFMSMVLLDESYSGWIWLALIMVMVGLALVQPRFAAPEPVEELKDPSNV